jgi:hypothetical protein
MYSIIMDAHRGKPLYLVVADVKEAYDNVWRDALWAKLATSHNCMEEVRSARAVCTHGRANCARGRTLPVGRCDALPGHPPRGPEKWQTLRNV